MSLSVPRYFVPAPHRVRRMQADLCVYGGTSGGVIAAIEGTKRGLHVVLVAPSNNLGGLSSGGLGMTDIGNKQAIGGLSREFYQRVGRRYGLAEEWRFEPHVAEEIFQEWLAELEIEVLLGEYIEATEVVDRRIASLRTLSGLTVSAAVFIDATYEGDLMARAGISYTVGREDNSIYGETLNGAQVRTLHQFESPIDPYIVPGVPASGVLPGVDAHAVYRAGAGDAAVQAYNFRMCLTQEEGNRIPFEKPADYHAGQYLLLKRYLATGWNEVFLKFDPVRNRKTDTNNHGAVSTDFIGMNHGYPDADFATREKIFQAHVTYQKGWLWTLANDPAVPAAIREEMSEWGLCRDEFIASGGWPHAMYVREARRMLSDFVMTEHHCMHTAATDQAIGFGAYGMDSHNCRRIILDGRVVNEGDVQVGVKRPYSISYRAIVPRQSECRNLLVTFCVSSSHIAFGSIRMEPVLMVLNQSAAIAAAMAFHEKCDVQDVPYAGLERELIKAGQIVTLDPSIRNADYHAELAAV